MEPNNNKKIIIALCCVFIITLLTIPFLKKDNQTLKTNKKEISNNFNESKFTNKVSKKKIVFVIIGIVVVILIISLIILFIKKRNNNNKELEAFLSKRCDCNFVSYITIYFGTEEIDYSGQEVFFNKDINSEAKRQFNFYKTLANDQNLKNILSVFYERITEFLSKIDGHLLKAYYDQNDNSNTPLEQMSKNFNENFLANQTIYGTIFKVNKNNATRPLSEEEEELLDDKNYVDLFKTIMQQDNIPYYEEQNEKLPLFEHCHTTYTIIKKLYSTELPRFFNTEGNKKYLDKYKNNIDNAMNEIKKCLEIKQAEENPSTQSFFLI